MSSSNPLVSSLFHVKQRETRPPVNHSESPCFMFHPYRHMKHETTPEPTSPPYSRGLGEGEASQDETSAEQDAGRPSTAPKERQTARSAPSPIVQPSPAAVLQARQAGIDPRGVERLALQAVLEERFGYPGAFGRARSIVPSASVPRKCFGDYLSARDVYDRRYIEGTGENAIGRATYISAEPARPWKPQTSARELQQRLSQRNRRIMRVYKLWLAGYRFDIIAAKLNVPRTEVRQFVREIRAMIGFKALHRESGPRDENGRFVGCSPDSQTTRKPA